MKVNPDKCHLLVCGQKHGCILITIGGTLIFESHHQKVLGISIDKDIAFGNHIKGLCKNAGRKLNTISRQCKILPFYRGNYVKYIFDSQFAHFPLVWMFHSRLINTKINNKHYRALTIIYRDGTSSFDELLKIGGCVTIHH